MVWFQKGVYNMAKSNWSKVKDQTFTETAQGRDVHSEQQMERGELQEKQSFVSRAVASVILAILAAGLVYGVWAFFAPALSSFSKVMNPGEEIESYTSEYRWDDFKKSLLESDGDIYYEGVKSIPTSQSDVIIEPDVSDVSESGNDDLLAAILGEEPSDEVPEVSETDTDIVTDSGSSGSGSIDVSGATSFGQILDNNQGMYVEDEQDGKTEIFSQSGQHIATKTPTDKGYRIQAYLNGSEKPMRSEVYENGVLKMAGNYDPDGTLLTIEYYKDDVVDHVEVYNFDGKVVYCNYYEGSNLLYTDKYENGKAQTRETYDENGEVLTSENIRPKWMPYSNTQIFVSLIVGFLVLAIMIPYMKRNLAAQNSLADTEDINQYTNDQHIMLPEEMQRKFDFFPDAGAHSSVLVSSMISHVALQNKGVNKIKVAKRYEKDVVDTDGSIAYYAGDIIEDNNGNVMYEELPMFDTDFATDLFETSGVPDGKDAKTGLPIRLVYDVRKIPYNEGNKNRIKLTGKEPSNKFTDKLLSKLFHKDIKMVSKYDTVADLINKDWYLPDYEPQRPAGAYIVDTEPVNTMVLAITRAGKGQTVIEPTIDMWTREKRGNNMVINDPKGELLVKFYTRGTYRGYQIVQFNLINSMKTDIYNPLGMAAQSAREGDFIKCSAYVGNVAEVFFPVDGGDDPVWPNAANNAFKRAAFGLIDYYLEEERKYRNWVNAQENKGVYIDPKSVETHIDQMWGKVTLYNCYQMFTQLTSKKMPNPARDFAAKMKSGGYEGWAEEDIAVEAEKANQISDLWNGAPEVDCLTLYFNATEWLPTNTMRQQVRNVNNALKSMAGAEKMMASVYGIAITAMSFFVDPTISTLTSGTPSQTVDLAGYAFPRRVGVRFHPDYVVKNHYVGLQCKWDAFDDEEFKKPLGKLFEHSDILSREGWAKYYFDGKFEKNIAYLRLQLLNASTGVLVHTYYFKFEKGYMVSLDGKTYVKDPLLGEKVAKNGNIVELMEKDNKYVRESTTFKRKSLKPKDDGSRDVSYELIEEEIPCITQTYVRYTEKPKMTFLVTPPHLMQYAKLILILIKQLFDFNVDQSYMTKSSQKPLYKTRYMLDELGNLQNEGHGISGFETMLSIGLGQEQQYTLILQTLQQLKAVYGDDIDKIVQGNTSNIVFLKSTDDSMLDTLQKMSGTTHKVYKEQKTVTRDMEKIFMANEGKISYMMQAKEVPVISYNDMAFIGERNSIVFRAGNSPIWNKNETVLPMSWRLFQNTIKAPGKEFSLQTIPTMSTAMDFDLKQNQPDFELMLQQRIDQAVHVKAAEEAYRNVFGYDDDDIHRLDIDVYAGDIMDMVNTQIAREKVYDAAQNDFPDIPIGEAEEMMYEEGADVVPPDWFIMEDNEEVIEAVEEAEAKNEAFTEKIYANHTIARSNLISRDKSRATHAFDSQIVNIYLDIRGDFAHDPNISITPDGSVCSSNGAAVFIHKLSDDEIKNNVDTIVKAAKDESSRVYIDSEEPALDEKETERFGSYEVTDDFYFFLASLDSWENFANGRFEDMMYNLVTRPD